ISTRGFTGTFPGVDTDIWLPATAVAAAKNRADHEAPSLNLIARLKPGISLATAAAEFNVLSQRIAELHPDRRDRGFVLAAARGAHPLLARIAGVFLMFLMAVVSVVLL